jgi:hypothetical protein
VHALALHTYTIKEWEGLQDTVLLRRLVAVQEVSPRNRICNRWSFSSMLLADLAKRPAGRFVLLKMCNSALFKANLPGNVKNAAAVGDNRSRLTKVMPL